MEIDLTLARQAFLTEATELLQEMESILLRLEKDPDDRDAINSLFRAAHTIKGSAGVLGIEVVEKFTHVLENLLSKVRDGEIRISSDMIETLLSSRDHIQSLITLAGNNVDALPDDLTSQQGGLIDRLNLLLGKPKEEDAGALHAVQLPVGAAAVTAQDPTGTASTDNWHISIRFGKSVLRDGMDPISFINYLPRLGEIVSLTAIFDSMPPLADMDPEECYTGLEIDFRSDFDKQVIEDVFEFVREESRISILPPKSRVESYIKLIDSLPEDNLRLGEILVKGGALTRTELEEALNVQQKKNQTGVEAAEYTKKPIGEILVTENMVQRELVDAAVEKQKKVQESKSQESKTIRVDAAKIDKLVNLVGELVISKANIDQHAMRIQDGGLVESASAMARLVEDIRDITMGIRMVPIGETFSRFSRVVRDISKELGKEIDLVVSGGETELDKTVVEKIGDPLMHLVRNAVDHGLEIPDVRVDNGKPAKGTIRLNAYNDAGSIVIEVLDDGRGLPRQKIIDKAVSLGMISAGQSPSDRDLYNLIFEPGFSTAEKVTKLSGRGVGMDVVRRNIEALRGTVELESTEGAGTSVRIRLPLTLAIIDGFMVGIGETACVIPLDMVIECVELSDSERKGFDSRSYINMRGEFLPCIRLREFYGLGGAEAGFEHGVVVQYGGSRVGLVVDKLYGEIQTVIKSLGNMYKNVEGISGGTILGDGTVALILDIPRLMQLVQNQHPVNKNSS